MIAIIITIMVLELRVPHGETLETLRPLIPVFLSYLLSFINVAIYWNNHHHMLHTVRHTNGKILWANMHLLFWLSLIPFTTGWIGENHFASLPMAVYGFVLVMCAVAYTLLQGVIVRSDGCDSVLLQAIGSDLKGKTSVLMYLGAIPLAFVSPWISGALYVCVAIIWLIPDSRIERAINRSAESA